MSFDAQPTLEYVQGLIDALDPKRFVSVRIGPEPIAALPSGWSAVIGLGEMDVVGSVLNAPIELHRILVRMYRPRGANTDGTIEIERQQRALEVKELFDSHFTLNGTVRAIDAGGIYEAPSVVYGDIAIQDKTYWSAVLTVPCIVDPAPVFAA